MVIVKKNVSSPFLLSYGIISALTIIFQQALIFKTVQFFLFSGTVALRQRKIFISGALMFFFVTVVFNLLVREGRVLFSIIGFPVTEDALERGISRALTLLALFYLSKTLFSGGDVLTVKKGTLTVKILFFLRYLTEHMRSVRVRTMLKDIDRLLREASAAKQKNADVTAVPSQKSFFTDFLYYFILAGNTFFLILQ